MENNFFTRLQTIVDAAVETGKPAILEHMADPAPTYVKIDLDGLRALQMHYQLKPRKMYYYTAKTGTRNANDHTWTRGDIYEILSGRLLKIAKYRHQSGGQSIEQTLEQTIKRDYPYYAAGNDNFRFERIE